MARKREERNGRKSPSKDKEAKQSEQQSTEENYASFNNQLAAFGLTLREIPGDGNCLFRALGDQLEGHARNHLKHRHDTVDYMHKHRADFEPFVEDDISFEKHVSNLSTPGTYAGNDAIVAFARLRGVTVVIHQLNTPLWQISGTSSQENVTELHIAFHNGDHYSSVRKLGDNSELPADIRIASQQQKKIEFPPHSNGYADSISGQTIKTSSYNELVMAVLERTGCQDVILVQDVLQSQDFDFNNTVKAILDLNNHKDTSSAIHYQPNPSALWGPRGTGARLFGHSFPDGVHGVKPRFHNSHLSSKHHPDLRRDAQRYFRLGENVDSGNDNGNHAVMSAIPDLKCLSI